MSYAIRHKNTKRYLHRQRLEDEQPQRGAHADFFQWREEELGAFIVANRSEGKEVLRKINTRPKDVSFRVV